MNDEGFFSRWSRRKQQQREGAPVEDEPGTASAAPAVAAPDPVEAELPAAVEPPVPEAAPAPPPPTLTDVAKLTRESDFSRFVKPDVDEDVKRAAMKKLFFSDPHFNTMDGLDVYIDDYSKPDPIPAAMLRKMAQSQLLGLFKDDHGKEEPAAHEEPTQVAISTDPQAATPDSLEAVEEASSHADAGPPQALSTSDHEDPDLRLQPDDAARPEGAGDGADGEPRRNG